MRDKCIIFTRVSTEHQDLVQQHDALRAEAIRRGFKDDQIIYVESKESAISKTLEEREGISSLLEELPNARMVLVWELSRLSRRADVMYRLRDIFIKDQIQLVCLTPPFVLLDENGQMSATASLVLALFTSLAESEMNVKQERMKRGKRAKIAAGFYKGGVMLYGYAVDNNKRYIPDPEHSQIVRKIFTMYSTGEWSLRALAIHLKDSGCFIGCNSNAWALGKIHKILVDSRYAGSSPHFPALVSMELFEKCASILNKHQKVERTANKHEMLGKSILCYKKTGFVLGCCPNMYSARSDDKPWFGFSSKYVDPLIWEESLALHRKYISNKTVRQKQLLEELRIIDAKYRNATAEVQTIQDKIDRLEERIILGSISQEKSKQLHDKLIKEYKDAESRKLKYEVEAGQKGQQMYDDYWDEDNGAYDNLSYDEKRHIILQVIDKIYASRSQDGKNIILEFHPKFGNIFYRTVNTHSRIK